MIKPLLEESQKNIEVKLLKIIEESISVSSLIEQIDTKGNKTVKLYLTPLQVVFTKEYLEVYGRSNLTKMFVKVKSAKLRFKRYRSLKKDIQSLIVVEHDHILLTY